MKIKLFIWVTAIVIALIPLRQSIALLTNYFRLQTKTALTPDIPLSQRVDKRFFNLDIDRKVFENLTRVEADSKAKITRISPSVKSDENEFVSLYTKEVTFEGRFTDILKLLSETEKNMKGVKFASISFLLVKEQTVNKLKAVISFQSVKLKENEGNQP